MVPLFRHRRSALGDSQGHIYCTLGKTDVTIQGAAQAQQIPEPYEARRSFCAVFRTYNRYPERSRQCAHLPRHLPRHAHLRRRQMVLDGARRGGCRGVYPPGMELRSARLSEKSHTRAVYSGHC